MPVSAMVIDDAIDVNKLIPVFKHEDDYASLVMVHVSLRIRGDLFSHSKPEENRTIDSIPDSLYVFPSLLLGSERLLEDDELDYDNNEAIRKLIIISFAGDLMYTVSVDRFLTHKHIGMANILHQARPMKELVNMFHKADHVMSQWMTTVLL